MSGEKRQWHGRTDRGEGDVVTRETQMFDDQRPDYVLLAPSTSQPLQEIPNDPPSFDSLAGDTGL